MLTIILPDFRQKVKSNLSGGLDKGTYALLLHLEQEREIAIGQLGTFRFPAGYYVYLGSAMGGGGLRARLARHLRREKKRHWHIDYFLEHARCSEIWVRPGHAECFWAREVGELPGAHVPAPGFGSSDCRCPAHLFYFPSSPDLAQTQERRE